LRKSLLLRGRGLLINLMTNSLSIIRPDTKPRNTKIRSGNLKKMIVYANVIEIDHLINKVLKLNIFAGVFKVNLINNFD
jgi:hypothetical protein